MVRVLEPGGVTGLGEKSAVEPAGLPAAPRVTSLPKKAMEPTSIAYWASAPAQIVALDGVARR